MTDCRKVVFYDAGPVIEDCRETIRVCLIRPCAPGVVAALREAGFRGPVEALECATTPRTIFTAQAILAAYYGPQSSSRKAVP